MPTAVRVGICGQEVLNPGQASVTFALKIGSTRRKVVSWSLLSLKLAKAQISKSHCQKPFKVASLEQKSIAPVQGFMLVLADKRRSLTMMK